MFINSLILESLLIPIVLISNGITKNLILIGGKNDSIL